MFSSRTMFALILSMTLCGAMFGSKSTQTQKTTEKPLTNADVVDMLKVGLSQEIVISKINVSASQFDTSPAALKELKKANIPDAVILAMVQVGSVGKDVSEVAHNSELSAPARVNCAASHADPVPVFLAPRTQQPPNQSLIDPVEIFKVECGDRITILGDDKQSWLKIRRADGQVGYISSAVVSVQPSANEKREKLQKAADDLEDCRIHAQNDYETRLNAVNTLTLTPIQRVYASSRLKQNLDAQLRNCRTQYESRLKVLEAQ